MPTSLYLTSAFYMTLLIDMSCIEYVEGDKRAMHGQLYGWCIDEPIQAQERLVVNLLVSDLLTIAKLGHFDGRHDQRLRKEIGCYPGMSHGGILSPFTSILRSNLTVLATFEGIDAMLGQTPGSDWYLLDAEPHELRCIEASLIEYLRGLMFESVEYYDTKQTWHDTISFLLGELSGQIFPAPGASGMGNTTPETPAHNPK